MPEAFTYLAKVNAWRRELERTLRPLNLTPTQALILVTLAGGPLQNGPLAKATGVSFGDISAAASRMEPADLLTRTHGNHDRRKVFFSLTEKGAALVPQITAVLERFGNQVA